MKLGVLALQGAFIEHVAVFAKLGVLCVPVRTPAELAAVDGLVIPGGESTSMTIIAQRTGMWPHLVAWAQSGRPTWGTCAGLILLSARVRNGKRDGQDTLAALPATAHRNYFGAQTASFEAPLELEPAAAAAIASVSPPGAPSGSVGVFIRAPALFDAAPEVEPLAWIRHEAGDVHVPPLPSTAPSASVAAAAATADAAAGTAPAAAAESLPARVLVAARCGNLLATAFHPELTPEAGWHALFAGMVRAALASASGSTCATASAVPPVATAGTSLPTPTEVAAAGVAGSYRIATIALPPRLAVHLGGHAAEGTSDGAGADAGAAATAAVASTPAGVEVSLTPGTSAASSFRSR